MTGRPVTPPPSPECALDHVGVDLAHRTWPAGDRGERTLHVRSPRVPRPVRTPAPEGQGPGPGQLALRQTLFSRGYVRLLLLSVVLGVPIALACFYFVSLQHELQHWVWRSLPETAGYDRAPWWWPLPALLLAGLLLAPVVTRAPGHGGHVPVHGIGGPPLGPKELPGVLFAALATLPLGVVLGPEAP